MQHSPQSHAGRIVRYLLWSICSVAFVAIALSWFAPQQFAVWISAEREAADGPHKDDEGLAEQTEGNTPLVADDSASPQFKTPLVNSITQVIQQQPGLFGNDDSGDDTGFAAELQHTLETADAILAKTQSTNRRMMKEVNRQPRAGRTNSPNIVLLIGKVTDDPSDLKCPNLADLRSQSVVVDSLGVSSAPSRWLDELMTGRADGDIRTVVTLPQMLWQSGYTTAVFGDCSWFDSKNAFDTGIDEWMGLTEALVASNRFPKRVWANGQSLEIVANTEGRRTVEMSTILELELKSYVERHRRGRPFGLTVHCGEVTCDRFDKVLGVVEGNLLKTNMRSNTCLITVTSPAGDSSSSSPKMILRWPAGRLHSSHAASDVFCVDLLPTLSDVVSSWHKPRGLDGQSLLKSWRVANAASKSFKSN
jgi:hypothetical protein